MAKKENEGGVKNELDLLKGLIAGDEKEEEEEAPAAEDEATEEEEPEEEEPEEELDDDEESEEDEEEDEDFDEEEEEDEELDDEDDEPADDEDDDADEDDDLEALRRQNKLLKKQLDAAHETPRRDDDEVEAEPEDEPIRFDPQNFLADDEAYDAALASRESLNELLNAVAQMATAAAVEQTLPRVTRIVKRQVTEESSNQTLVREYFSENRDLRSVRKFVATTFNDVLAENPKLSNAEALTEAGNRVRAAIGTARSRGGSRKSTRRGGRRSRKAPSLPGGSRGRRSATPPKGIADEIAAMKG
jgi:hypothetical protein